MSERRPSQPPDTPRRSETPCGRKADDWSWLKPHRHEPRAGVYLIVVATPVVAWLGDRATTVVPELLGQFTAPAIVLAAFGVMLTGINWAERRGRSPSRALARAREAQPRARRAAR